MKQGFFFYFGSRNETVWFLPPKALAHFPVGVKKSKKSYVRNNFNYITTLFLFELFVQLRTYIKWGERVWGLGNGVKGEGRIGGDGVGCGEG